MIRDIKRSQTFADDYLINGFEASTMPLRALVYDAMVNRVGGPEDVLRDIDEIVVRSPDQVLMALYYFDIEKYDQSLQLLQNINTEVLMSSL